MAVPLCLSCPVANFYSGLFLDFIFLITRLVWYITGIKKIKETIMRVYPVSPVVGTDIIIHNNITTKSIIMSLAIEVGFSIIPFYNFYQNI